MTAEKPFQLWRKDDAGQKFLIKTFHNEQEALEEQKKYEERGHKQMYEVINKNSSSN